MFKQRIHESLVEILEKSSSLTERLNIIFNGNKSQKKDDIVNSSIKHWCQVVAQDNWEQFENFLAWDGLDLKTVNRILGFVSIGKKEPFPAWLEILNEYLINVDSIKVETLGNNDCTDINEQIPFEEILLPFIYVARQRLVTEAGSHYDLLSEESHASFERRLLWRLSYICSPTIELEFSVFRATKQPSVTRFLENLGKNSKEYYQNFVEYLFEGGLLKFFQEYPVLARLAATVTDLWVDATREFICRLESDKLEIQHTFQPDTELGQVVAVQANLSDYHNNGRSVIAVQFASSLKLIYKPKDIGLEEAYFRLLSWFNEQSLFLPFKLLKIINRSTYGWVEFAESLPCKEQAEAQRYYQRAGALLCLVYILEGTDLHNENIIACGEHPVLIDLETLMHPVFNHSEALRNVKNAQELAYQKLNFSVLRSGLLPYGQFQVGNRNYDSSGLGGSNIQETLFPVKKWKNINSDMMVVAQEYEKVSPHANVPSLEGFYLSLSDYYKEFVDGFRQMYELLIERKQILLSPDSPLTMFAKQQVRFVFRPTAVYSSLLEKTLNPKFMRDGVDRSIQLDLLSRGVVNSEIGRAHV
jgi:type 2 lantibiotic biosynthesis protein LanM